MAMIDLMDVRTVAAAVDDALASEKKGGVDSDVLSSFEKVVSVFELPFASPLAATLMRAIQAWCAAQSGREVEFAKYSKQARGLDESGHLSADDRDVIEVFLVRAAAPLPGSQRLLAEAGILQRQRTVTIENIDADVEHVLTTLDRKMGHDLRIARTMTED